MARRKKSDNTFGIFYIIGLPFILIFWFIKMIGKLLSSFTKKPCVEVVNESNKNSLVIDASKDMKKVQKILKENYQDFLTYPAIQQILPGEQLQLMQYIWQHWNTRIDLNKLYKKYPQYEQEILERIDKVESARSNMYYKKQEFWDNYMNNKTKTLIGVYPPGSNNKKYYCLLQDMIDVFEYYIKETEEYEFLLFPNYIAHYGEIYDDKELYFWTNNKFSKIDKGLLLKLCKDAGIKDVY